MVRVVTSTRLCASLSIVVLALGSACGRPSRGGPSPSARGGSVGAAPATTDARPVVLFLGTSLTAGLGVAAEEAFPALIQEKIDAAGLAYRVVNAGVSGETSAGALRRLEWVLRQPVAVLVVETGANDGLRGQDTVALRENLETILDRARLLRPPPKLVVVGMEAPPNLGDAYARQFRTVFPAVARSKAAVLIPFLLQGVAGRPELNQADGIHPTPEGHLRIAETVWRYLRPLL